MKRRSSGAFRHSALLLGFLLLVACRPTQQGGGIQGPPSVLANTTQPTEVVAWIDSSGEVVTMEQGLGWVFRTPHGPAALHLGPAIANDGAVNWMLMWVHGPELRYRVGIGRVRGNLWGSTSGVRWSQHTDSIQVTVPPHSSPAIAYGNHRWVVVFRRNDELRVLRSIHSSATLWDTPATLVRHGTGSRIQRAALTSKAPALAFGNVDGQDRFVLVYDSPNGAVAATSTDAVTWSPPVVIGPTEKDPAVDVFSGDVYVLLSEAVGTGSHRGIIYRSPDAGSWTEFARYASNFNGVAGPGMAMTTCGVTITEIGGGSLGAAVTERSGSTPGVACAGPTFTFSRERPVTDGNQRQFVGDPRARTAVAFLGR